MSTATDCCCASNSGLVNLQSESVMIFVDYDNLIRSFRDTVSEMKGVYIDMGLMKELLADDKFIVDARVYSGFVEGRPISKGLWKMGDIGFKLHLEPVEKGHQKGVDMSIGIDAIECARQKVCDTIILVTGDGDFAPAVRKIKSYGVKVQVASFRSSLNDCLSAVADDTIILDELRMVDTCEIRETIAY